MSAIDSPHATIVDLLRARTCEQPEAQTYTFLLDGETEQDQLTNAALDRRARAIALMIRAHVAPGERVVLLYPPGLDFIAAFFGCLYAGAVAVPVYPPDPSRLDRTLPRLRSIMHDSGASLAMTTSAFASLASEVLASAGDGALPWLASEDANVALADTWCRPDITESTLALLQYTSGSTAEPKGVMVSHRNLLHNSAFIHRCFRTGAGSRGMIWLPPYHDMGLIGGLLQPLYAGFPVTLMSPLAFLQQPVRWLAAISRTRATISGAPNFAYDLCVRKISPDTRKSLDLSSWELAFSGAERVCPETLERFAGAFEPCGFRPNAFLPCYGLAEATLIVSGGRPLSRPALARVNARTLAQHRVTRVSAQCAASHTLVACGDEHFDQEVVIADPDRRTRCPANRVGEIWVSGPSVAQGYWNRPEETAQTFRAYLADTGEGPFLRTGDLGFVRRRHLFPTGRLKDLIIVRGQNRYPHEIEHTVEESQAGLRPGCSAAFSVDSGGAEELVIAAEVDRAHAHDGTPAAMLAAIRLAVERAHELRVYAVVLLAPGTIPKTSSGKIRRSACRMLFLEQGFTALATWRRGEAQGDPATARPCGHDGRG